MAYISTIIVPPSPILKKFDEIVKSLYEMIQNNEQQSRTFAQIRDALLPKLMSGEINISITNIISNDGT
jgi:type I restriction enzyme S subunit